MSGVSIKNETGREYYGFFLEEEIAKENEFIWLHTNFKSFYVKKHHELKLVNKLRTWFLTVSDIRSMLI